MIENIRQEFIQLLKEADWLDDESRIAAIEKVSLFYSTLLIVLR
jgi:hypothetical protein